MLEAVYIETMTVMCLKVKYLAVISDDAMFSFLNQSVWGPYYYELNGMPTRRSVNISQSNSYCLVISMAMSPRGIKPLNMAENVNKHFKRRILNE